MAVTTKRRDVTWCKEVMIKIP
uniref:Uncharacterized protein n=1 Tax=Arundo donax TaxID=35708 RepID=A0A0A8ZPI3_ARUDO